MDQQIGGKIQPLAGQVTGGTLRKIFLEGSAEVLLRLAGVFQHKRQTGCQIFFVFQLQKKLLQPDGAGEGQRVCRSGDEPAPQTGEHEKADACADTKDFAFRQGGKAL